jgi:hypothetical protein
MLIEKYEEALRELEELETNLENKSNNEIRKVILQIAQRGREQIKTMYGMRDVQERKFNKEQLQKQFNDMLKVAPITKVNIKEKNDDT